MKCNRATTTAVFLIAMLLILSANTGCATFVYGSTQLVTFTSTPDPAQIEIVSKSGDVIERFTTPTSIELKRGGGYFRGAAITVRASASGHEPTEVPVRTHLNGWYFGNVVIVSSIGLLIVDPLTGAMFSFPEHVHFDLTTGVVTESSLSEAEKASAREVRDVDDRREVARQ